jgi:hypothetical protein
MNSGIKELNQVQVFNILSMFVSGTLTLTQNNPLTKTFLWTLVLYICLRLSLTLVV